MKALKFTLSGKTAFFKIPEVNTYLYYSYGQLPRVALLGILGAVMGFKGYSAKREDYPEFYEKLKNLEIAILPNTPIGIFPKKLQVFNNSTGFASYEKGGNLIVKQVWLEDVSWEIFIKVNSEIAEKLTSMMLKNKAIYLPYLGSNDHLADIKNVEVVELEKVETDHINSLVKKEDIKITYLEEDEFKYEEYLPWELEIKTERHISYPIVFTNTELEVCVEVFNFKDKNMVFYGS